MAVPVVLNTWKLVLMLVLCPLTSLSSKILLFSLPSYSRTMNLLNIGEGLISNGHEVYILTHEGGTYDRNTSIKLINVPCTNQKYCNIKHISEKVNYVVVNSKRQISSFVEYFLPYFLHWREALLQESQDFFLQLQEHKFDLMILDSFLHMYRYLVPHRLGIPYVTYSEYLDPAVARVPYLPSTVPHMLMPVSDDQMTLFQRLYNFVAYVIVNRAQYLPPLPHHILETYRQYGHFETLKDLESRSILWLHQSDVLLDYKKPQMPYVIHVGGLSLKPIQSLPNEFQQFADKSKEGLIIVSFGSLIDDMPADIATKFISAFGQLNENVIWRFKNSFGLELPKNIKVVKWLPQNDLLAHKNVKLIVTHGGRNGLDEALYHGVPVLCVPFHQEQKYYSFVLRSLKYGLGDFSGTNRNIVQFELAMGQARVSTMETSEGNRATVERPC